MSDSNYNVRDSDRESVSDSLENRVSCEGCKYKSLKNRVSSEGHEYKSLENRVGSEGHEYKARTSPREEQRMLLNG